ncbi:MAG: UDP-N-acetylglucosamine 1-carboxyvinyltransferase [Phycisphaeraceae bacterium]|nr:UDP-N-acetylglucosamine 1-carboxyvinyltransferase [Phycisphaeraceae bacterium]
MDAFVIHGGRRLRGRLRINGSKNAALPMMAAALMTDEPVIMRDVPDLADIRNMAKLLRSLGTVVEETGDQQRKMQVTDPTQSLAHYDIVRTMRASICVLGPALAKRGQVKVSMPGGCSIGDRPVDLHLRGLQELGAKIHLDEGYIVAQAPSSGRLKGAKIFLGGPFGSTVLGTDNVMCAAALAEGTTVIESAACEPEVVAVANMLNAMGAKVHGAGTPRITIEGVPSMHGAEVTVIPDRIEAGTYILAGAITNGDVVIDNCPIDALGAAIDRLIQVGIEIEVLDETDPMRATIRVASARRLQPIQVTTQPHPGFPTDLQAQIMALLCLCDGNSIITEKIYPDRFLHVAELLRMGANLTRTGSSVLITGVRELIGAPVMASDLRASAGLVLAGLAARGTTTVNRVYHLDRGYEKMELSLRQLGADIERVDQDAV